MTIKSCARLCNETSGQSKSARNHGLKVTKRTLQEAKIRVTSIGLTSFLTMTNDLVCFVEKLRHVTFQLTFMELVQKETTLS